jgi:lactoylglutathione lyase
MPRYLHTQIFVDDLPASIAFYTEVLGLRLLSGPKRASTGDIEIAFVGLDSHACIELTRDLAGGRHSEHGSRYGHLAIEVDGPLDDVLRDLRARGVKVVKEPWRGSSGRDIAMIEDPNGVWVELFAPQA